MNAGIIMKPVKDLVEAVKLKTDNLTADPASIAAITAIKQKSTSPAWDQDTDSLEAISEAIAGSGGWVMLDHTYTNNMGAGSGMDHQITPGASEAWLITFYAYCNTATAGSWLRLELCWGTTYRELDYHIDSNVRVSSLTAIALHGSVLKLRLTGHNASGSQKTVHSRISGFKMT